ncbi:hypothetical protein BHM03_00017377 [Ensete ventricosum]|nr:hypothetical protein BHM03_00017377 [Ensete ventricosum]
MGRHTNDPTVLNSSIALLQERFKQLQRVREMREERQLQGSAFRSQSCDREPPRWLFPGAAPGHHHRRHGEEHVEVQPLDASTSTSTSAGLLAHGSTAAQSSVMSNEADVDTSLHL